MNNLAGYMIEKHLLKMIEEIILILKLLKKKG